MPAGTIALSNGSTTVNGTGTSFTTELKVGDFVGVIVGGAPYTIIAGSITSNTQLTLNVAYNGPTASGLAWYAIPASLQIAITQKTMNDIATMVRGMLLEKANWQQIYTGTGTITVTLPDGSTFTGPAWNGITTTLGTKLDKTGGNLSGSIAVTDGTNYSSFSMGNMELVAASPFIDFHYANNAVDYVARIINDGSLTLTVNFHSTLSTGGGLFRVQNGGYCCKAGTTGAFSSYGYNLNWNNPGTGSVMTLYVGTTSVGNITLASTSDKMLKTEPVYMTDEDVSSSLAEVMQWKTARFRYKARGIIEESIEKLGFIANDLVEVSPQAVIGEGLPDDYDIEANPNGIDDAYTLDPIALIAKLTMAFQAQQQLIVDLQNKVGVSEDVGS
ncbi:tail fiber domain-containing protein [Pantoea sp. At-9b]|uniref:tail fiber domain-containing protein n=1 Tax=Pantoea sp. (strain At-9b) TaxID=592316 RepID=UPI0001F2600B|nr:tail fiber domain-containing protein [Pantoea sp. At-9b]ADU71567.1 conserved hypothetical protein [Pantoea sp. At-9b]